jgi:hypothetical protein
MADAELLQLGKQIYLALRIELIDAAAAVRGHDLHRLGLHLEQPRHKRAAALLEIAQDSDLVIETLTGEVTAKRFVHPAIEPDSHRGPRRGLSAPLRCRK